MTEKIPIDEYGEGNCCPACGSLQISNDIQYYLSVEMDLRTGKEIIRDHTGKRIYKPSRRLLAAYYKASQYDEIMHIYRCRKCGWRSETFVP